MESNLESSSQDVAPKKSPLDELNRDELINKCKGLLVIAQKAKQAKSDVLVDYKKCQDQLAKYEKELKVTQESSQTLQELVDSLTEQKLNYITEIDMAHNKVKFMTEKFNNLEYENGKLKVELLVKENNSTEHLQKLSDLDSEVTSLKRQNHKLIEENEELIKQLTDLEPKVSEFNEIGLHQREQLKYVEEKVLKDKVKIEELHNTIQDLQTQLQLNVSKSSENQLFQEKIIEMTNLYENEKCQKEKANVKLRSYKDKIFKCAACINQLKNSRYILSKTVQEYSENIPKWQSNIIKASKVLDEQIIKLNKENTHLKENNRKLTNRLNDALEYQLNIESSNYMSQINDLSNENTSMKTLLLEYEEQIHKLMVNNQHIEKESQNLKIKYDDINNTVIPTQEKEIQLLKDQLNESIHNFTDLSIRHSEINCVVDNLKSINNQLNGSVQSRSTVDDEVKKLNLQMKALQSEKEVLVDEKLTARDRILELEYHNKELEDQIVKSRLQIQDLQLEMTSMIQNKNVLEDNITKGKNVEINDLQCKIKSLQEQYELLKKEHENITDLNGLLKEEVDTLKMSLEQPKDETENYSDENACDLIKLESKLSVYKQENNNLLMELKESRVKVKEYDALSAEYDDVKSKLASYKTENTELLNEMKEINQVLKERGESISKLQKAIDESELLIEKFEKDREQCNKDKHELLKKIESLENILKDVERKNIENLNIMEQTINERDNVLKANTFKDNVIATLKEEIEKIKLNQSVSELPNEDMSTSTISKADEQSRMKDLDETFEEKYTKLRIFALKLKKKLNETSNQLTNAEQDKARLEKLIKEHEVTINKQTEKVDVDEIDASNMSKISDLESKVEMLTANREITDKLKIEVEKLTEELSSAQVLLTAEVEAHKTTKECLEKTRRNVKKKNVLSLEMEDYERSMKELTTKMDDSRKKMVQMESTIDTQEGTITAMKTQIKLLEEQIKTEETQNRLLKEELQQIVEESNEKDNVVAAKNNIILKLERDLEDEKRKNEEASLEMTSLMSDKENVIMRLGGEKLELNNKVKRFEFKCAELNEKLKILNIELEDLKTEYTSYKVRAQAVLRQNQTVDHSHEEQLKEEAAALRSQIEIMTTKLESAVERCAEQSAEVEASRRRTAEATSEVTRAQQRTARLHADIARLTQQLDSERTHHKLQVTTLTQCYKTQISELEIQHQKAIEDLRRKTSFEDDRQLIKQASPAVYDSNRQSQYLVPVLQKDESDGEMDINVSLIPREEGEGSESAPSPLTFKTLISSGGRRSPVPLERLLEEGVPEDEALDAASLSLTPEQEIAELKRKLLAQQQRVKHVTMLLAESERDSARMSQLSELLKTELRRVRGSTQNAHNTEYMKNVTLKFLTLAPGDERSRLVPVLQKILTLTNDETHKIQAIAKGLDPNASKGWGSYLPWPGGNVRE